MSCYFPRPDETPGGGQAAGIPDLGRDLAEIRGPLSLQILEGAGLDSDQGP